MANAKLTIHAVTECGYFKRNLKKPELGDLATLLSQFQAWAKDGSRKLSETCTYHIQESSNLLRTFCYDLLIDTVNGDALLITWNEIAHSEGNVSFVKDNAKVGEARAESVALGEHAIPGFPTFFYFIPEVSCYATVRFSSPLNGNAGMHKLLKEYLAKFAPCVVHDKEVLDAEGKIKVLGIQHGDEIEHLYARFKTELLRKPAFVDYILGSCGRIRKVLHKNLIIGGEVQATGLAGLFQKLAEKTGFRPEQPRAEVPISYSMSITPTKQELQSIIKNWDENISHNRTGWEDVGFQLQGEAEPRWLSSSMVKLELPLNVEPDENGVVSAAKLLAELQKSRQGIIKSIRK